ncbi:hypothetical protein L7F22_063805 [Adiantum nelumboides]|nr:hypothetical protein [Adiantum nelumboides]
MEAWHCPLPKLTLPVIHRTACDALPSAASTWKLSQPCFVTASPVSNHILSALTASTQSVVQESWEEIQSEVNYLASNARIVQWYPGHIAKAERELKALIKLMDVIIEVRDARIPLATSHPEMTTWIKDKMRVVVMNRVDMITTAEKDKWANYFASQKITTLFTDGRRGLGVMKLGRTVKSVARDINEKRRAKGLLPRAVRAVVVGYPNVGKSSLINRLLKRRKCEAAPRPGVTRELQWARIGEDLDLLDAPGLLPMRLSDQAAAIRLAICHDIGESSYAVAGVAAVFVEMLLRMPNAGVELLEERYKIDANGMSGEVFLEELAQKIFAGDINHAALRLLQDYRKGCLGWIGLEWPPFKGHGP